MSRVIAIANQKGGVGKTTTAINLGAGLAVAEKRTLIIDMDPQGNATSGLGIDRASIKNSVYDVIVGDADVVVTLASPATSARMCAPLDTRGTLSCRNGDDVVLTHHRWVHGADAYGGDRTSYRQYLVSHEVGHALGNSHLPCPGPGQLAPTMMQQTKGVEQCVPQPWPYP